MAAPSLPLSNLPLFGRHEEMQRLQRHVSNTIASKSSQAEEDPVTSNIGVDNQTNGSDYHHLPSCVVLYGKSGSGKSSLVQHAFRNDALPETTTTTSFMFAKGNFTMTSSDSNNSNDLRRHQTAGIPFSGILIGISDLLRQWVTIPSRKEQIETFLKDYPNDEFVLRTMMPKLYALLNIKPSEVIKRNNNSRIMVSNNATQRQQPQRNSTSTVTPRRPRRMRSLELQNIGQFKLTLLNLLTSMSRHAMKEEHGSAVGRAEDTKIDECHEYDYSGESNRQTTGKHIILFLDNIQRCDPPTLDIILFLSKAIPDLGNLLLVLAYREEDVDDNHPVHKNLLSSLSSEDADTIHVTDLSSDSVNELVSNLLSRKPEETLPLAKVVHQKAGGNPFYTIQFLKLLQQENLLYYDMLTFQWTWKDETTVQKATNIVSDSVASLVVFTMKRLERKVQHVLQVASCLGTTFPYQVLAQYFEREASQEQQQLVQHVDDDEQKEDDSNNSDFEGSVALARIETTEEMYQIMQVAVDADILIRQKDSGTSCYMWSHDSLQQTAYSMIPESKRSSIHLRLGKLLMEMLHVLMENSLSSDASDTSSNSCSFMQGGSRGEWTLYMAADQMNKGLAKVSQSTRTSTPAFSQRSLDMASIHEGINETDTDEDFLVDLVNLNLDAAQLAMSKSSIYPARDLLRCAAGYVDVCPPTIWGDNQRLLLELYCSLAEMEFATGNYEESQKATLQVLQQFEDNSAEDENDEDDEEETTKPMTEHQFRAYQIHLKVLNSGPSRDYAKALDKTLEILKRHGQKIPRRPNKVQAIMERARLTSKLPKGQSDIYLKLPLTEDDVIIKRRILMTEHVAENGLMANQPDYRNLINICLTRLLRSMLKHGIDETTPYALFWFAYDSYLRGEYRQAWGHAQVAIKLADRLETEIRTTLKFTKVRRYLYSLIYPLVRPNYTLLDPIMQCSAAHLQAGEIQYSITAVMGYALVYLCVGLPIGPLASDMQSVGQEARQFGVPYPLEVVFHMIRQTILNLQGKSESLTMLVGDALHQEIALRKLSGMGLKMTKRDMNTFRLLLACIYREWAVAKDLLDMFLPDLPRDVHVNRICIRQSYVGLACYAMTREKDLDLSSKEIKFYQQHGDKMLKQFEDYSKRGMVNALPVVEMLRAEASPKKERFDEAIKDCSRAGLIHHEAYLNESACIYFMQDSNLDEGYAKNYLNRAIALYQEWGADGKVNQLSERYQTLLEQDGSTSCMIKSKTLRARSRHSASRTAKVRNISLMSMMQEGSIRNIGGASLDKK